MMEDGSDKDPNEINKSSSTKPKPENLQLNVKYVLDLLCTQTTVLLYMLHVKYFFDVRHTKNK